MVCLIIQFNWLLKEWDYGIGAEAAELLIACYCNCQRKIIRRSGQYALREGQKTEENGKKSWVLLKPPWLFCRPWTWIGRKEHHKAYLRYLNYSIVERFGYIQSNQSMYLIDTIYVGINYLFKELLSFLEFIQYSLVLLRSRSIALRWFMKEVWLLTPLPKKLFAYE